jgi:hypothetical protein
MIQFCREYEKVIFSIATKFISRFKLYIKMIKKINLALI